MFKTTPMLMLLAFAAACADDATPASTTNLEIRTAPLNLPGIGFACYDVLIQNGAATPETVVALGTVGQSLAAGDTATLCSTQYGNGAGGDISYVAPCDASQPNHTVTLWVDGLYEGTPASPTAVAYQDPCGDGCSLTASCAENADTPVVFDLTIMRPANQGFFDVAVNFDDIFCSAKLDCEYGANDPIELLFDPTTGARGQTAVLGFACTAGASASPDTVLHMNDIVVTCDGFDPIHLDPTAGPGNAWKPDPLAPDGSNADEIDSDLSDPIWQYAIYRGREDLSCDGVACDKLYWNVAIGFDPSAVNCSVTASATASSSDEMGDWLTPEDSTYPWVSFTADLTNGSGQRVCTQHPLNVTDSGVGTTYTPIDDPKAFCNNYDGTSTASTEEEPCLPCACDEASGYAPNVAKDRCVLVEESAYTDTGVTHGVGPGDNHTAYGTAGTRFFSDPDDSAFQGSWDFVGCDAAPGCAALCPADNTNPVCFVSPYADFYDHRLQKIGIWSTTPDGGGYTLPVNEWIGFTACIDLPADAEYLVGMGGDNHVRFDVDGELVWQNSSITNFYTWNVFRVRLAAGPPVIGLYGKNNGSQAGFGAEIAGPFQNGSLATADAMRDADYPGKILFSTANYRDSGAVFTTSTGAGAASGRTCPTGYTYEACGETPVCKRITYAACE